MDAFEVARLKGRRGGEGWTRRLRSRGIGVMEGVPSARRRGRRRSGAALRRFVGIGGLGEEERGERETTTATTTAAMRMMRISTTIALLRFPSAPPLSFFPVSPLFLSLRSFSLSHSGGPWKKDWVSGNSVRLSFSERRKEIADFRPRHFLRWLRRRRGAPASHGNVQQLFKVTVFCRRRQSQAEKRRETKKGREPPEGKEEGATTTASVGVLAGRGGRHEHRRTEKDKDESPTRQHRAMHCIIIVMTIIMHLRPSSFGRGQFMKPIHPEGEGGREEVREERRRRKRGRREEGAEEGAERGGEEGEESEIMPKKPMYFRPVSARGKRRRTTAQPREPGKTRCSTTGGLAHVVGEQTPARDTPASPSHSRALSLSFPPD